MKKNPNSLRQKNYAGPEENQNQDFISIYRVSLVKDQDMPFGSMPVINSVQAQGIIRKLIETRGQADREQFCVILLNAKNHIIGLNIVSVGSLTSTTVEPREVMKPALLCNAAAMILCHNHPSNDAAPSGPDILITRKLIHAANLLGIRIHEHLIISMEGDDYYSFADHGHIADMYSEIRNTVKGF